MIITIKSVLAYIIPMIPVMGAGVVGEEGGITKLSTASMLSRLLELAILGAIFLYTTVQVLDSKIGHIEVYLEKHEIKCEVTNKQIHEMHIAIMLLQHQQLSEENRAILSDQVQNFP